MREQIPVPPPKFQSGDVIVGYSLEGMTVLRVHHIRDRYYLTVILDTVCMLDDYSIPMKFPVGWHDFNIIDKVYDLMTPDENKLLEILR